jgi:hypothetical protein
MAFTFDFELGDGNSTSHIPRTKTVAVQGERETDICCGFGSMGHMHSGRDFLCYRQRPLREVVCDGVPHTVVCSTVWIAHC